MTQPVSQQTPPEPPPGTYPEEVDGLSSAEMEAAAIALGAAITVLMGTVIGIAIARVFMPGIPHPSVNDLSIIPDLWNQRAVPQLIPQFEQTIRRSAQVLADALNEVAPEHVPHIPSVFEMPAPDMGAPIPRVPAVQDVTAAHIMAQARNRIRSIGDDLWAAARAELVDGLDKGETVPELTARIRSAVGKTEPDARRIARTEVIAASNAASLAQARSAGYQMDKVWHATHDDRVRAEHLAADGQSVGLDEPFHVGGEDLQFPGDPTGRPDNVINERCSMGYRIHFPLAPVTAGALHRPALNCCTEYMKDGRFPPGPCLGHHKRVPGVHIPVPEHERPTVKPRVRGRAKKTPAAKKLPEAAKAVKETPVKLELGADLKDAAADSSGRTDQKIIDFAYGRADMLSELEELVGNEAEPQVLAQRAQATARRIGMPADDPLVKAAETGDPAKIREQIAVAQKRFALRRVANPPQSLFDPKVHKPIGRSIRPGEKVQEVRPGYDLAIPGYHFRRSSNDGYHDHIPLFKPVVVQGWDEEQPPPLVTGYRKGKDLTSASVADLTKLGRTINTNAAHFKDSPDSRLHAAATRQGFDALPEVISKEEADKRVKAGQLQLWRVTHTPLDGPKIEPAAMNQQFRTGPYRPGKGSNFGNGIYAGPNKERGLSFYGDGDPEPGSVLRIVAKPEAHVVEQPVLLKEQEEFLKQFNKIDPMYTIAQDPGRFAVLKGYDIIHIPRSGGPPETSTDEYIILNRSAVAVEEAQ